MKLLIVEDEKALSDSIVSYLGHEDYLCEQALTYGDAMMKVGCYEYDCILLDLMLPGGSGLEVQWSANHVDEIRIRTAAFSDRKSQAGGLQECAGGTSQRRDGRHDGRLQLRLRPYQKSEVETRRRWHQRLHSHILWNRI
jgi:response regulator RpfG family c-di-GMP phosphodiesterase